MKLHELLNDFHKSEAKTPWTVSRDELRHHANTLAHNITENRRSTFDILERHEDTIRKRWRRKKTKDREAILLEAWPDMAKDHRPDLLAASTPTSSRTTSCIWPYINLEDLKHPEPLLIFLNARVRNAPHTFALQELLFSPLARMRKAVLYRRLPKATMLLTDLDCYGKIKFFNDNDNPQAAQLAEQDGVGLHPGEGLQVLRIQERIYSGLLKCCHLILHDYVKQKTLLDDNIYPIKAAPIISIDNGEHQNSFANMVMLEPYQPRGGFDVKRLRHLVASLLENSKDEAWALREDPSYFAEYVNSLMEHRPEIIADAKGKMLGSTTAVKASILSGMVQEKSFMLIISDHLSLIVELAMKFAQTHPGGIRSEDGSPKEYFDTLQDIRFVLEALQNRLSRIVETSISGSPLMRRYLLRVETSIRENKTVRASVAAKSSLNPRQEPLGSQLYHCLKQFGACGRQSGLLYAQLDLIESIRQRNPSSKDWISSRTDWALSQLSTVSECLRVFLTQPWATRMTFSINMNEQELAKKLAKPFSSWIKLIEDDFEGIASPGLGFPSDGKFNYPVNKPRNEKTIKTMREAEDNLDSFWNSVDAHIKAKTGSDQHEAIRRIFAKCGTMRRTAPWVALEPQETSFQSETKPAADKELPYSQVFHDSTKEITGSLERLAVPSKVKEKRKGIANPPELAPEEPIEEAQVQEFCFEVNKKDASVWKALFFQTGSSGDLPGKVKWSDFKSALCNLQFSARQLHGSAWEFTPRGYNMPEGNGRPIQFHEPHPDSSIPFLWARRFGRRLGRAYGLNGEMFMRKE
jgi:hypothetical protein